MYLIYVDESGNTGARLDDPQQPVDLLAAVFVPEQVWLRGYLYWRNQVLWQTQKLAAHAGMPCPPELHAADVYHGARRFRGMPRPAREQIIRAVLTMLDLYHLDVIYSACHKRRLASQDPRDWGTQVERWGLVDRFLRPGHIVPSPDQPLPPELPGAIAWSLLVSGCNAHLARIPAQESAHGLLIADRSKLQDFARQTVRATQLISFADHAGPPSEDEVEEWQVFMNLLDTVHFVDSHESPYMQLADFVAYFIMRAWRAGNWERPGPEPHYDELVRPAIRRAYHYPPTNK